jgi:type IV pilus assembly protein PilY1
MDDIAKYMHENDFRPDFPGTQTLDVYTIGFNASASANAQLQKTALVSNGLYFASNDEAALAQAIINSLKDIIEKSQSFTAATVPASRTVAGEQIYVSLFTPTSKSPYWNGTLRSYKFTAAGQVLDANGNCAISDPTSACNSGAFLPTASNPPYWDAAGSMPSPGSRNLFVSRLTALGAPTIAKFEHISEPGADAVQLAAVDLGVTFPPGAVYNGSTATDAESLTAEIIANVRGCFFGGGANGVPCTTRPSVLSDIFHSNPVVVGKPGWGTGEPSFSAFSAANADRDRVIYAGSNGGFMHGFHAGDWLPAAVPPQYSAGTGVELFGFMPWYARQRVRHLPQDTGGRDYYYVDGSPQIADAWIHTLPGQTAKLASGSEWRTVLTGGMRQGGETYFALDVTDPAATSCPLGTIGTAYPCLMWEFPLENGAAAVKSTIGETWGEGIVTRIKLNYGGNIVERWVTIVTGGYHATGDPNDHASYLATGTKGRSIWILDLKTGRPIAKRQYNPAGSCSLAPPLQANSENGMCFALASTPAVFDADEDGFADVIIVGDLGGNVWKWVIKNVGWDPVNDGTKTTADNNAVWPFRKIFRAPAYGSGPYYYKSFYFPPQGFKQGNVPWFALGSGERSELLYMSNSGTTADNNRFYVFKDIDIFDAGPVLQPVILETNLLDVSSSSICSDVSAYKGYFIVGNEGEKWVTNSEILNDYLFVGSYIPVASSDPCTIGGESYLYRFRASCGEPMQDGTPASVVDPRAVDLGTGFPTDPRITVGPNGDADVIVTKQGGELRTNSAGQIDGDSGYWREVNN